MRTLAIRNVIDNQEEGHDINNKGINDTHKYIRRSLPQLRDGKTPDVSPLSNLFIDQCLNVINSGLVN